MLNWRPAFKYDSLGSGDRISASSKTWPVRINFVARKTVSGFIQFAEPRWSAAPHLEGQRSLSGGIFQPWARRVELPKLRTAKAAMKITRRMLVLPSLRYLLGLVKHLLPG